MQHKFLVEEDIGEHRVEPEHTEIELLREQGTHNYQVRVGVCAW